MEQGLHPEGHSHPTTRVRRRRANTPGLPSELVAVLEWYFTCVFGVHEGPGVLPFYCDRSQVGEFAVPATELAQGSDEALFRLFVALSMFQGIRDVVVMKRQRSLEAAAVAGVASSTVVGKATTQNDCPALRASPALVSECDVWKQGKSIDCHRFPGRPCHVKTATATFNRMGDMGKLPTSAWLQIWKDGGPTLVLRRALKAETNPRAAARAVVREFANIHRVGVKLASLFVSVLSTPSLAPGVAPWFPELDGHELVVVDTNVARAVDLLQGDQGSARTYDARQAWIREQAARIDLSLYHREVPRYSPRLVQQALYSYASRSNRNMRRDPCADAPCSRCVASLCPFHPARRQASSAGGRDPVDE
jgi:hypothetical protein